MNIGEIYWINAGEEISHPHVVIEINNDSLLVVALTTNQNKISMPGVVILHAGEANLEKDSIVEVYKTKTINKNQLREYIGTLSELRVKEILNGMGLLERSFFNH